MGDKYKAKGENANHPVYKYIHMGLPFSWQVPKYAPPRISQYSFSSHQVQHPELYFPMDEKEKVVVI
jgi:hypothetical protein